MTSPTPLPCPWCGGPTIVDICDNDLWCWVECRSVDCDAWGPTKGTPEAAITAWNAVCRLVERGRQAETETR